MEAEKCESEAVVVERFDVDAEARNRGAGAELCGWCLGHLEAACRGTKVCDVSRLWEGTCEVEVKLGYVEGEEKSWVAKSLSWW